MVIVRGVLMSRDALGTFQAAAPAAFSSQCPLLTFLCVILDYWAGKSPKSALLKAVRPHFSHYAVLFLLTKWKMLQTFLFLIKHISASVVARPFQTNNCSPDQRDFFLLHC